MTQSDTEYHFELFDLRRAVLDTVATHARNDDLDRAKDEAKRMIQLRGENPEKDASAFETSFDRALETVTDTAEYEIEIEEFPDDGILPAKYHDAAINPSTEIDGDTVEILTSRKEDGLSVYPIVSHPSGFRVCTCPAQRYFIVCPHTLARVLERNWAQAPIPA